MNTRFNRFIALALVSTFANISAQAANDFNDEKTAKAFEIYCKSTTEKSNAARAKKSQPALDDVCKAEHGQRENLVATFKKVCSTPDMCMAKALFLTEGNDIGREIDLLSSPVKDETAEAKALRSAEIKELEQAFGEVEKIYNSINPENAVASINMLEAGRKLSPAQAALDAAKEQLKKSEIALKSAEDRKAEAEAVALRAEVAKHKEAVSARQTDLDAADKVFTAANVAFNSPAKVSKPNDANIVLQPNADQNKPVAVSSEAAKPSPAPVKNDSVAVTATKDPTAGQVIVDESKTEVAKTESPKSDVPKVEAVTLPAVVKAEVVKTEAVKTEAQLREIKAEVLELGVISVKTLDGKNSSLKDIAAGNFKNRVNACVRDAQDTLAPYLASQSHKGSQVMIQVDEIPAAEDITGALAEVGKYTMPIAAKPEAFLKATNVIKHQGAADAKAGIIPITVQVTSQGEQVCKTLQDAQILAALGLDKKPEDQKLVEPVLAKLNDANSSVAKTGEQSDASRTVASNSDASISNSRTKFNLALCKEMGCAKLEETPQGGYIFHMVSESAAAL